MAPSEPACKSDKNMGTTYNSPLEEKRNSNFTYFMRVVVSIGLFYLSTIAGDRLMEYSLVFGFVFPIIVLCICVSYWILDFISRFLKWRLFYSFIIKVISVVLAIVLIWLAMPLYVDLLPTKDTIEMPKWIDGNTEVQVHYGTRPDDWFYTKTTVAELSQKAGVPFAVNGQNIFTLHVDDNRIYIDTLLFAGIHDAEKHIFSPPVVIRKNMIIDKPDDWRLYLYNTGLEIQNQDGIPVLLMKYKNPYQITISGLFVTPMGICKVNNETGIFILGDTLSQIGVYTVDMGLPRSIFDLFKKERTYILGE